MYPSKASESIKCYCSHMTYCIIFCQVLQSFLQYYYNRGSDYYKYFMAHSDMKEWKICLFFILGSRRIYNLFIWQNGVSRIKYLCSRDRSSITDAGWLELYSSRLFTRIAERHFIEHKIAIGCPAITQGKHSEQHPSIRNNSHDRLMRWFYVILFRMRRKGGHGCFLFADLRINCTKERRERKKTEVKINEQQNVVTRTVCQAWQK